MHLFREGGNRLTLTPTGQDHLPDGDRNGSRHEIILREPCQDQSRSPMLVRTAVPAKPNVGINGKSVCRVTEYLIPGLSLENYFPSASSRLPCSTASSMPPTYMNA